jgi:hypothetical protein
VWRATNEQRTVWPARQFRAIRSLLLLSDLLISDLCKERKCSTVCSVAGKSGGMGRYTYSILPSVSLVPWFKRFDSNRCVITSINRMMSNHSCLRKNKHCGEPLVRLLGGLWDDRSRNVELRKIWIWKATILDWLKSHWYGVGDAGQGCDGL